MHLFRISPSIYQTISDKSLYKALSSAAEDVFLANKELLEQVTRATVDSFLALAKAHAATVSVLFLPGKEKTLKHVNSCIDSSDPYVKRIRANILAALEIFSAQNGAVWNDQFWKSFFIDANLLQYFTTHLRVSHSLSVKPVNVRLSLKLVVADNNNNNVIDKTSKFSWCLERVREEDKNSSSQQALTFKEETIGQQAMFEPSIFGWELTWIGNPENPTPVKTEEHLKTFHNLIRASPNIKHAVP